MRGRTVVAASILFLLVAAIGLSTEDSATVIVSADSTALSSVVVTLNVWLVCPAGIVSVPEVAVKSLPDAAVPLDVE